MACCRCFPPSRWEINVTARYKSVWSIQRSRRVSSARGKTRAWVEEDSRAPRRGGRRRSEAGRWGEEVSKATTQSHQHPTTPTTTASSLVSSLPWWCCLCCHGGGGWGSGVVLRPSNARPRPELRPGIIGSPPLLLLSSLASSPNTQHKSHACALPFTATSLSYKTGAGAGHSSGRLAYFS